MLVCVRITINDDVVPVTKYWPIAWTILLKGASPSLLRSEMMNEFLVEVAFLFVLKIKNTKQMF